LQITLALDAEVADKRKPAACAAGSSMTNDTFVHWLANGL
jgi:hypothetical protein